MPKALITGATGLLGREIFNSFKTAKWDVVGTGLSRSGPGFVKLDLLDKEAVEALVEKEKPSIIIHSAAERSPDAVAADPSRATALNVTATAHLAGLASAASIPLLYVSTDYVFPGVAGEAPYAEDAIPRATNQYGQLKLDGEQAVLQASTATTTARHKNGVRLASVLRVPVLYGRVSAERGNAESAVNVLVDKTRDAAAGKDVTMDDWARRFPTNTADIGAAAVRIAGRWLAMLALAGDDAPPAIVEDPGQRRGSGGGGDGAQTSGSSSWPPILHFSAPECFTKYEMCCIFADILGLDISNMEADKDGGGGGGGVQRPYDTQLATDELEKLLDGKLHTVGFKEWWTKELKG